ncbi:hypothetical protein HYDPIDRAFT_111643 [Hydnomerulius pinastri MD-312]|uniref:DUF6533 domain-containing protein n=1 Tax=Hydnomerulius pinastri MD-312 TaxID=994086 RepID=A0A0C9WAG4_9AGAM|nr:hypothetical protein HYDPIDRAFT_111643 [Hydnomerulius pinastri MD-312]
MLTSTPLASLTFFEGHPDIVRDVRSNCFASLALMVWDSLLTFGDEVEYIWPTPRISKFKCLYLFLRYINLAALTATAVAISFLTSGSASELTCRIWFVFVVFIGQFSSTLTEVILAVRAYALCSRSRRIALFLCILIWSELITASLVTLGRARGTRASFGTVCLLIDLPKKTLFHAIPLLITQTALMGLITIKSVLAAQAGWGRTPLVSLLMREGIVVYFAMLGFLAFALMAYIQRDDRSILTVFWFTSIMSIFGCRLILNMERLSRKLSQERMGGSYPAFTTQIELE